MLVASWCFCGQLWTTFGHYFNAIVVIYLLFSRLALPTLGHWERQLYFYFHTSLWCFKRFYEGLKKFKFILKAWNRQNILKVVSATFLLVWFACLKEYLWKKKKCLFLFGSSFRSSDSVFKFELFKYSNVKTCSNAYAWNTKQILLNNLRSKHSLLMKFGQFITKEHFLQKKNLWKMWPGN